MPEQADSESNNSRQNNRQNGRQDKTFAGLFSSSIYDLVFGDSAGNNSGAGKWRGLVVELPEMFDRIRENSPAELKKVADRLSGEWREIARRPRALGIRIEEKSPWLSRKFLGAASNLLEPFQLGMGLKVERLEEEVAEVSMPGYLRNQGEGGMIHPAAMSALAEFTTRTYWEHHLDLRHSELVLEKLEQRCLAPRPRGEMRALFRTTIASREETLHLLRLNSVVEVQSLATIYDEDGRLVAEIEVSWKISRHLALGGNHATGSARGTDTRD